MKALADALNTRQDGSPLPKDEWKLVYPGYTKGDGAKNGKIYYSQPVSDFELEFLLNQIDSSLDFTIEEKDSLKKRLMNTLSSKYFKQGSFDKNALVQNPSREVEAAELLPLQYKLSTIRKHILSKEMLELEVVDADDKENSMNIRVSPYRIIKKDHKLWLICNWHDRPVEGQAWPRYTDDLTSIDISKIISLSTAQTPDETYIHWTSTRALLPGQSYTRISYANRITKARYGDKIKENLKKFDENIPIIELKHMKDN